MKEFPRSSEDLSFVVMQESLLAKDREEVTVIASEGVSERAEDLHSWSCRSSELRSCVTREVGLCSHSLSHFFPPSPKSHIV